MTTTAAATEAPPSCTSVLHLCDTALNKQIEVNKLQAQLIADQETRFNILSTELVDTRAWYKNPVVDGVIGMLLGGFIVYKVRQ